MKPPRQRSASFKASLADALKAHTTLSLQLASLTQHTGRLNDKAFSLDKRVLLDLKFLENELNHTGNLHLNFLNRYEERIIEILNYLEKALNQVQDYSMYTMSSLKFRQKTPQARLLAIIPEARNTLALYRKYAFDDELDRLLEPEVPVQEPAPIRVAIDEASGIHLIASQTHKGSVPVSSIERLRQATLELLTRTINQVESSSNADPRLSPNLRGLLQYITFPISEMPVEALGLNYRFAQRSFKATRETLPDALSEQIEQILTTVNVMLNQFDEWVLYTDAESASHLTRSDLDNAVSAAKELEEYFESNQDFVEASLTERLKEITDAFTRGLINIDSVAVPLIASFGNIFSEISRYVIAHVPEQVVGFGTVGTGILFLGFAIKTLERFAPTMSSFSPLRYLLDIQKYVHKNFSLLKDAL